MRFSNHGHRHKDKQTRHKDKQGGYQLANLSHILRQAVQAPRKSPLAICFPGFVWKTTLAKQHLNTPLRAPRSCSIQAALHHALQSRPEQSKNVQTIKVYLSIFLAYMLHMVFSLQQKAVPIFSSNIRRNDLTLSRTKDALQLSRLQHLHKQLWVQVARPVFSPVCVISGTQMQHTVCRYACMHEIHKDSFKSSTLVEVPPLVPLLRLFTFGRLATTTRRL